MHLKKSTDRSLQEQFLTEAIQQEVPVTLITKNGIQMKGIITSYDVYTIVLKIDSKYSLINKSAVSTIISSQRLSLFK